MTVGTTRGKRRLGRFLKPYLERSGLKIEQIATQARTSRQTVSRLFTGGNLPRYHLFTTLLSVLDVTGKDRERALELWDIADAHSVTIEHANELPPIYMRFRMDETEAILERTHDTVLVTGMLQTPAYAAAVAQANRRHRKTARDYDAQAERRDRQELLNGALELHALLDEVALLRLVGGPKVLAEQLDHLLEMSSRPNVTIQVVPLAVGAYGAMSGSLALFSFPEDDEPDAAYIESLTGMATVDNDEDVAVLSAVWDGAAAAALPAKKSVELIREVKAKGP